jgi:Domain of unknown function (DUF1707)
MTEGASPAGDRRDRDGLPSLRASHGDRDRAVEVLRDAAGDGRLTASEFDERVEAALTARTGSELAALTADLPAAPRPQAKELVRIDQRFGEVARVGRWVVPVASETWRIQVTPAFREGGRKGATIAENFIIAKDICTYKIIILRQDKSLRDQAPPRWIGRLLWDVSDERWAWDETSQLRYAAPSASGHALPLSNSLVS